MKSRGLMICFAALVALTRSAGADTSPARFDLERPLERTFEAGRQGRVLVDGDVFGQARNFPNDVRIFDSEGVQWPFFLYEPRATVVKKSIGLNILNSAWVSDPEPYLQFDVAIPDVDGKTPVHNRLELITSGHAFVRRVEIFAGTEPSGHMASGYLIEFSGRHDARNGLIRYPDSDLARLRVRIYPNAQSAGETFEVAGAYLQHLTEKDAEREAVPFTEQPVDNREQKDEAQTYVLDIGHANRPVEFIHFDVNDRSYTRCVSVYGRNNGNEEWRRVGGGEIHALPDDRNDTVKLQARYRFLKVQVYHYDDQPLDIATMRLEAIPRYLVFEAAAENTASLYFRGWDITAPRFDLRDRIKDDEIDSLPIIGTGETRPNAMAKVQPWRKYSKLLAGLAVGAVSLLVIWIIAGMMRQAPPEEPI